MESIKSIKSKKSLKEIKEQHGESSFAKSIDIGVGVREQIRHVYQVKQARMSVCEPAPQRSIDYPYIKRKNPPLSEMVRKRLLFKKLSHDLANSGDSFSNSMEKEHVPKTLRRIIIRQDNSIEIAITRPPRLRRQTFSEDISPMAASEASGGNCGGGGGGSGGSASMSSGPHSRTRQTLNVSPNGANDRRKTIETCENIFLQSEESVKLRARTPPSNPHRILLYKDKSDKSIRSRDWRIKLI